MKARFLIASIFALAFLLGMFIAGWTTGSQQQFSDSNESNSNFSKERGDHASRFPSRMNLAARAAQLSKDEWPKFFSSLLPYPEKAHEAAELWAEADPDGFWAWLRDDYDATIFSEFASQLLRRWTLSAPDAAMNAASSIIPHDLGSKMRRLVVGTALSHDFEKGIELAARSGKFHSYSLGKRPWMHDDPARAVKGLASLPASSHYRNFLGNAFSVWAEQDSQAAFKWLNSYISDPEFVHDSIPLASILFDGFITGAKDDSQFALQSALAIDDPQVQQEAFEGLLASGQLALDDFKDILSQVPPVSPQAKSPNSP